MTAPNDLKSSDGVESDVEDDPAGFLLSGVVVVFDDPQEMSVADARSVVSSVRMFGIMVGIGGSPRRAIVSEFGEQRGER